MKLNQKPQGQPSVFIERAKFRESTDSNEKKKLCPGAIENYIKCTSNKRQLTLADSCIDCYKQASFYKQTLATCNIYLWYSWELLRITFFLYAKEMLILAGTKQKQNKQKVMTHLRPGVLQIQQWFR